MRNRFGFGFRLAFIIPVFVFLLYPTCKVSAITSKITRHSSGADFAKGETQDIVVGSRGTVQLGSSAEILVSEFEDVWSINTIVVNVGTVFLGTSPNGGIYKYSMDKLTKIYPVKPVEKAEKAKEKEDSEAAGPNEPNDVNAVAGKTVEAEEYLANEHIFAMAIDISGRLLAGISGEKARLVRFESDGIKTVFEPNDSKYIFAIAVADTGNVYLGTGPEGKVYALDPLCKKAESIYDSPDKNILSLAAGADGFIYAGSDSRGLIYKIDPTKKKTTVLYDSEEPEITALLSGNKGNLFATATSAKVVSAHNEYASQLRKAGRPEGKKSGGMTDTSAGEGGLKLKIANTPKGAAAKSEQGKASAHKPAKPGQASYIYNISSEGYVTEIFAEKAVLFNLCQQQGKLLVGTGNSGMLYIVDVENEEYAVIYEDQKSSQITAAVVDGEDVYLGTANPAKLVKLAKAFASEGTYTSDLIDASQPAKWGKLQIEADIPRGCKVLAASRSGNVKDINDPTFSDWTELVEVTGPVQLRSPVGRFCQYKLTLRSKGGRSPVVREVAVAHTIPNLAPKVESVNIERIALPIKKGVFKISYKAVDGNGDKLIYKIDFRKEGRKNWIELKEKVKKANFEWDGRTVEDGRYEIRIIADDQKSNTTETKLTGSRISDIVVVDNTGPVISEHSISHGKQQVTLKLQISDKLSMIGQLDYTVDSNADWTGTVPDDSVYDTTEEDFTIVIAELKAGEHVITVRLRDDVGNITYKTFDITVAGN